MTDHADAIADQLRAYDQAVVEWVESAPLMRSNAVIPVVMATPDRAFASMQDLLRPTLGTKVDDIRNIPLPFASVSRSRILYDQTRFHGNKAKFDRLARTADNKKLYQARFPAPFNIGYQVELWAKNRTTLNAYELYCLGAFSSFEMFLKVNMRGIWDPWGLVSVPFENEGVQDASDLEPMEGHRVLRFTQSLLGKGWVLAKVEELKVVLTIFQDSYFVPQAVDTATLTAATVDANPTTYPRLSRVTYTGSGSTVTTSNQG